MTYRVNDQTMTSDELIEFARSLGWTGLMGIVFALHEGVAFLQEKGYTVEPL